jgi:hypothetical protein
MDESSTDFAFILHLVDQYGANIDTPLQGFLEQLPHEEQDLTKQLMDAGQVHIEGTVLDLLAAIRPTLGETLADEDGVDAG